jgi:hypothetical protein
MDVAPERGYLPRLSRWCNSEVIARLGWDVFAH